MSGINRFGFGGVYVLHSDHEAEVGRLTEEIDGQERLIRLLTDKDEAMEAEVARLRAEVEAYRKDAMRYRWLRNEAYKVDEMSPAVLLAEAAFPVDNCHTAGFVFGDELDEQVDAAMGADA